MSPEQAIAIIERLDARIERTQWTYRSMVGRLTDAYDRKTATFRTETPFIKTTVIIEPLSGRYRCDSEGIAKWEDGIAPYIGYRHSYSFDGQQQRRYMLEKPGTTVPTPEQATGQGIITGEHHEGFMQEWTLLSGAQVFPPYLFGKKLSDLLKEHLQQKKPVEISEDTQGLWTIRTKDDHFSEPGYLIEILYDLTKETVTGTRGVYEGEGKPRKIWSERYVELTQTENGFWVPRQIDYVNFQDRTIDRMLYSDIKVNQPVDDSIFRFVFPLGTQVTDDLEAKRYVVGKGAVNDEAATLAYAQMHGLRLGEDPPPLSGGGHLRRTLLIATLVLVTVLLLLLLWRWRIKTFRGSALLLLAVLFPSAVNAAELSERGEWLIKHGNKETIHVSQCGMNVAVLVLNCFSIRYNLRQVAEALPPTWEGISFGDIQTVLQAHGLHCVARQNVTLSDLKEALRPNMMAIFAVPGPDGYKHYLAAINHPRQGCLLLDPPQRSPVPVREAVTEPYLQPISGLVLFVGRDRKASTQASRVTLLPATIDLGSFSTTDTDASKPYSHKINVTNTSPLPILVSRVTSACGCITPEWRGGVLRGGETREVPFMLLKGAWGHGRLEKKTALIFADSSDIEITWNGEGLSDVEMQHLNLSADTIRINLDELSKVEPLERTIRVWIDGEQTDEFEVSSDASWLAADFQPLDPGSGTVQIRITGGEKLRNEEYVEGKVFLSTRRSKSPAIIKVILFRQDKWRLKPDVLSISRGAAKPQTIEVVSRSGIPHLVKQLKSLSE